MKRMINKKILILLSLLLITFFSGCFLFPPTNHAPTITSTEITTATVGIAYTYDVEATDPDEDILIYSLPTKPADMTINSTTGLINWIPTSTGDYDVMVEVSDNGSPAESITQSFTIRVEEEPEPTNHAPTITSTPITSATVCQAYSYNVEATDPDGDTLTYSLTTKPTGMTINSSNGLINWTPKATGDYNVTIEVADNGSPVKSITQSFTITVSAPNHAPTITSTEITTATVGVAYTYDVDATDSDGDILTYCLITKPAGMTINSGTGQINWTPASTGDYDVTIEVSDNGSPVESTTQNFTIHVEEEPEPTNQAPIITSTPFTTATVNQTYAYDVNATDPDGDTLTYSLTTKPTGMIITSTTGLINWAPTSTGDYDVTVRVSDGSLFDTQSFIIKVSESPSEEIELIEVVSGKINLEEGGVIEVTDESSEIYGTRVIIEPIDKGEKSKDNYVTITIFLANVLTGNWTIGDYQGFLVTPVVVKASILLVLPHTTLELPYNEDKLSNAGVSKDDTPNLYRLNDENNFKKVPENEYSCNNNKIITTINWGEEGYYSYHALTVTNCQPPDNLGQPLPGDLVYRLSRCGENDNWLPGHVGIYVGKRYHKDDGVYNIIEALLSGGVERNYYPDITNFGNGPTYMGACEPAAQKLSHSKRNKIIEFAEDKVGMPYASCETFGVYFGWARGDYVKGAHDSYNCVGLTEAAYELKADGIINGIDIVSDYDEGNLPGVLNPDRILSPQEQYHRTVPATGAIDQNTPPEISNLEIIPEGSIEVSSLVFITCNASDADQDDLTYIWTVPRYGTSITFTKGKSISWVTPNEEGRYEISCKVIDNYGGEDDKSIKISVGLEAYTITASAGPHGSISPSGDVIVNEGSDKSFTITPDTGYYIADVLVDGSSIGAVSSHTFTNVTKDHTISATFITGSQYPIQWSTAESNGWANPLGEGEELITSTEYDYNSDIYLQKRGRRHVGVDIHAQDETNVYAIADGTVDHVFTQDSWYDDNGILRNHSVIIIKHTNSENGNLFAIYGHVLAKDNLESTVKAGEKIGVVKKSGSPCHLHFGINLSSEITDFMFTNSDGQWGWGRIPAFAIPSDYGWVDPIDYLNVYSVGNIVSGPVHNLTKDTYYNTIQEALDGADSLGGDNIEVDDGTYNESITFPANKVVTLQSASGIRDNVIIQGANNFATVTTNVSSTGTTLRGFTITHTDGDAGIGINNGNGNLIVENCIISSNTASRSGGGICNYSGTLTITSSTISSNTADEGGGGGIYNCEGTIDITESTISGNTAYAGSGIFNGGTLTITSSTISGNAADEGGGIYNQDGILTITSSTISSNTATSRHGGGIGNNRGTLTITSSTISYNTATYSGGGIDNNDGTLTITSSTISDNTATADQGGGIHNNGTLDITSSNISDNTATRGGGINNYGTLTITSSTISGNTAANNKGGGIYSSVTLTITSSTISGNTAADDGGGIHNCGTLTITGSTISGNISGRYGGGIGNDNGTLTITSSNISDNTADDVGGGIGSFSGTLTITGSSIFGNNVSQQGGGIYLGGTGTITIGGESPADKNTICGNYKSGYDPSLDQQIRGDSGDLYETYKDTNYISAYCE